MIVFLLACLVFLILQKFVEPKERRVIVTSHFKEDLSWLKKAKWDVVVIDHKGSAPSAIKPLAVIPNRGREASSYLKYILDNWDNLPDYVAFIHGHEDAWHHFKGPLLPIIENTDLEPGMYTSLNYIFGQPLNMKDSIQPYWGEWLGLGPLPKDPPCAPGAAQFIVARDRILSRPKKLYQDMYDYIIDPHNDHYAIGCFYEYIWHYIFTHKWNMCVCET